MAKLPEVAAREKALELLEKQKKQEQKSILKEEKENAQQKDKEKKLKKKTMTQLEQRKLWQAKRDAYWAELNSLKIINDKEPGGKEGKKGLKHFAEDGTLKLKHIKDDEKTHKVCVEYEKTKKNGEIVIQDKQHVAKLTKKLKEYLNNQNEDIKKYFFGDGEIPVWTRYQCTCCGKLKKIEEFHKSWSFKDINRMDVGFQLHKSFCKDCAQKLFLYHYYKNNKNEELAMERYCADTDTYWDVNLYIIAKRMYENNPKSVSVLTEYIGAVGRDRVPGKTYWDSPIIRNNSCNGESKVEVPNDAKSVLSFSIPIDWVKEEVQVRNKIIKLLRYDPFKDEDEEDKKVMYRNLELMIDDSMSEDFVKLQAAIEIVRGFMRIEKLRQQERSLELNGATAKEIQDVSKLRKEEMTQITNFSKDNGFAARYAQNKAKGAGTLTGCMNAMKESYYEDGIVNYYDVKTCKEMQEAANMSIEAIFKQIALTDNDTYKMIQTQTERIIKMQKTIDDLKEEVRKKNLVIKEKELIERAKKEGKYQDKDEKESLVEPDFTEEEVKKALSNEKAKHETSKEDKEMEEFFKAFTGEDLNEYLNEELEESEESEDSEYFTDKQLEDIIKNDKAYDDYVKENEEEIDKELEDSENFKNIVKAIKMESKIKNAFPKNLQSEKEEA